MLHTQQQYDQQPRSLRLAYLHVSSAGYSRNLVKAVVAVMEVLGSRIVEMMVTQILITRGLRASRLAEVSGTEPTLCVMYYGEDCVILLSYHLADCHTLHVEHFENAD